jgi:hypothetical protein
MKYSVFIFYIDCIYILDTIEYNIFDIMRRIHEICPPKNNNTMKKYKNLLVIFAITAVVAWVC